mgnify:CR=1 FL=1
MICINHPDCGESESIDEIKNDHTHFYVTPDVKKLKHLLKAKSVLFPGLKISFLSEFKKDDKETWEYPNGLEGYLGNEIKDEEFLLKD